jgi:hypothetical protein
MEETAMGRATMATEHPRELALSRNETAGLMRPSRECLPDAEYRELVLMVSQLRRAFPHQDLADSLEILTRGFEILAVRHGMRRVREALETLLVEPGRRFFPLPGELSEVLQAMKEAERRQILRDHPFVPCGRCDRGIVLVDLDGTAYDAKRGGPVAMKDCACKIAWRQTIKAAGEQPAVA